MVTLRRNLCGTACGSDCVGGPYITLVTMVTFKICPATAMQAPRGGGGGIVVHILDSDTRWGRVVSVTPQPPFTPGKGPLYPLDRRLGGLQSWSGHRG
jgi:hypothetical protein